MNQYEIEIKSLLGDQERADHFRNTLIKEGAVKQSEHSQLNHYFIKGDFEKLLCNLNNHLSSQQQEKLLNIIQQGRNHSVRTRDTDGEVKIVIKASVDETTSTNGIKRFEFEEHVGLTLKELDTILLAADFEYQAKWSREREEYSFDKVTITLDRNAGYGWLSEFELVVSDPSDIHSAEHSIRELMERFGLEVLSQERLERMFHHYNQHWSDYYGTDKIFTIE